MKQREPTSSRPREFHPLILHLLVFTVIAAYVYITNFIGLGCLIRRITGVPCPGCGMTRSVIAILHLDFRESFYYHPLTLVVLPLILILVHFRVSPINRFPKWLRIGIIALVTCLMFGVYIFRLILGLIP